VELATRGRRAPQGIRRRHARDQGTVFGVHGRPTTGGLRGQLGPILAEAAPLPPEDGVGGHDQQGLPPPGPALARQTHKRRSVLRCLGRLTVRL
jgi:hypothetical protein